MNWCFAIVNGRLAEVYFEKFRGRTRFLGHAYVDRKSFKSRKSQMYIKHDTGKFQFTFGNGKYKSKLDDKVFLLKNWVSKRTGGERQVSELLQKTTG